MTSYKEYEIITLSDSDEEPEDVKSEADNCYQIDEDATYYRTLSEGQTEQAQVPPAHINAAHASTSWNAQHQHDGVGGFLSDYGTLTREVLRLRASNNVWKQNLELTQTELNKVSYEWCTSQELLAENEALLKSQANEISSLNKEAAALQSQVNVWDSKLNIASHGLEMLFQQTTQLNLEHGQLMICDESGLGASTPGTSQTSQNENQLQLMTINQNDIVEPSRRMQLCPQSTGMDSRKRNVSVFNKLKMMRDKFKKQMREKLQSQEETANELADKNEQLENLTRILGTRTQPLLTNNHEPVVQMQTSTFRIKQSGSSTLKKKSGREKSSAGVNSKALTQKPHARDSSIPVKEGYRCECGERFKFLQGLHRHLGLEKQFICKICKMSFMYFSSLRKHLQDNHQQSFPPNAHGCRACGAIFPSKNELMKGWKHRNGNCLAGVAKMHTAGARSSKQAF